jgi:tetratricopeptide (TPR) repeat protein
MSIKSKSQLVFVVLAAAIFVIAPRLCAQGSPQPDAEGDLGQGKNKSPDNYENTMNMAPTRETNAFKAFEAIPESNTEKKIKTGEEFVRKFATSAYLPSVYAILSIAYINSGQYDKGFADGEKALSLRPDDVRTLANMAQSMARVADTNDPNAAQKLAKAEQYAQKCLKITPTLKKPDGVADQEFATNKNQVLAMAHGALGTIDVRRGKFADALPDLQQAIALDPNTKDPTNYYLLGVANENSSHYTEAAEAFTMCAAVTSNLQQGCRDAAADAKKRASSKSAGQ